MTSWRFPVLVAALLTVASAAGASPAAARSVGQVIDDTAITTEVKAKLVADKLSNLTKIDVKTIDGIVTLTGVVEDAERRARAAQIASGVNGVKGIVNNVHVAGSTIPPAPVASVPAAGLPGPVAAAPPAPGYSVDATGVVASVDPTTGTITLQDGRVLRTTRGTMVWQPSTLHGLRPGTEVLVRDAAPVAVQPPVAAGPPEWRMGTVRSVDRAAGVVVLQDGTVVRLGPTAIIRRGSERLTVDHLMPGTEVVVRTVGGVAEGSALPGRLATGPTVEASEISVVWTPVGSR